VWQEETYSPPLLCSTLLCGFVFVVLFVDALNSGRWEARFARALRR